MHRVVVVDDDEPNLQLYSALVERVLGGEAIPFSNPLEALAALRHVEPSLIVVDFNMPELDGVEFIVRLRTIANRSHVPIMMLTAQGDETLRERALTAGANVFLSKPFATVEFIRHVRHLASWAEKHTYGVVESSGERERDAILRLHRAMDTRDSRTARHMRIARDVAVEIATEMGVVRRDLDTLRWAALVYDIGKLAIPENVLGMPAQLSPASRALIHAHAEAGAGILAGSEAPLLQTAESIARHHHERYDGEGYPDGLRGEEIPLFARIIAVADSLVALTSQRPHRGELLFSDAAEYIVTASGTHFDPTVVEAFQRVQAQVAEIPRSA